MSFFKAPLSSQPQDISKYNKSQLVQNFDTNIWFLSSVYVFWLIIDYPVCIYIYTYIYIYIYVLLTITLYIYILYWYTYIDIILVILVSLSQSYDYSYGDEISPRRRRGLCATGGASPGGSTLRGFVFLSKPPWVVGENGLFQCPICVYIYTYIYIYIHAWIIHTVTVCICIYILHIHRECRNKMNVWWISCQ